MPGQVPPRWLVERSWLWGAGFGLCVGGGVVLVSSLRYGPSAPLVLLGLVLAIVFGALALMAEFVGRRARIE